VDHHLAARHHVRTGHGGGSVADVLMTRRSSVVKNEGRRPNMESTSRPSTRCATIILTPPRPRPRCSGGWVARSSAGNAKLSRLVTGAGSQSGRTPAPAHSADAPRSAAGEVGPLCSVRAGPRCPDPQKPPGAYRCAYRRVEPPHPGARLLDGQHIAQLFEGSLGQPVTTPSFVRLDGGVRGDVYDSPGSRREEGERQLHEGQGRDHVGLEHSRRSCNRRPQDRQRGASQRAGVVHEHVQTAGAPCGLDQLTR